MTTELKRIGKRMRNRATGRHVVLRIGCSAVDLLMVNGRYRPSVGKRVAAQLPASAATPGLQLQACLGAMRSLIEQIEQELLDGAACSIILPNHWCTWASLPWADAFLTPDEQNTLARAALQALRGDAAVPLAIVCEAARPARTSLAIGVAQAVVDGVRDLVSRYGLRLRYCAPAQVWAWRHRQVAGGQAPDAAAAVDYLLVTADARSVTYSWLRATGQLSGARCVLRSTNRDGGNDVFSVAAIRRECLLQGLTEPQVSVGVLDTSAAPDDLPPAWHFSRDGVGRGGDAAGWEAWALTAPPRRRVGKPIMAAARDTSNLDLDFSHTLRPGPSARGALAGGLVFMATVTAALLQQARIDALDAARDAAQAPGEAAEVVDSLSEEQHNALTQATKTAARLNAPWNQVLAAVESSRGPDVAWTELTADAQAGSLHMAGDARHFDDILQSVGKVRNYARGANPLREFHLVSHLVNNQDGTSVLHFEAESSWRSAASGASASRAKVASSEASAQQAKAVEGEQVAGRDAAAAGSVGGIAGRPTSANSKAAGPATAASGATLNLCADAPAAGCRPADSTPVVAITAHENRR